MSLTKISTVVGGALVLGGAAVAGLSMSAQAAEAPATSAASTASTQAQASSTTSTGTATNEVTKALDAAAIQEYGTPARESLAYLAAADPANDLYLRCIADRTASATTGSATTESSTSNGTTTTKTTDSSSLTRPATAAETAVGEQSEAFCAPLEPAPPWELDRSNPEAAAFAADVVERLTAAGVTEAAVAPDDGGDRVGIEFGGAGNDASSISKGMELLPSVALEVARG